MNDKVSPATLDEIRRQQALLKKRLDEEQQVLTTLAKRLWAQQESEKSRLSRELHDGVGQLLTALSRRLQGVAATSPEFQELQELAELALADVRQLSRMMSPTILDDLGLKPALKWLCRSLFEHETAQIRCDIDLDREIPKDISILIFRITQETLVNSIKHSNASLVNLSLVSHQNVVRLDITDNGTGFDRTAVEAGIGLCSIADRTAAFQADFVLNSAPGKGTHTAVKVPL